MAEQTTFTLKGVVDLDTAQATKNANKLKASLDDAVKPRPGQAAKATSDKASGQGETKTARSIGAGGGTGSAASDFAAQAQGLGGLVHVYATFAANIFAVSAAFNALSKAMDVTNLVKGLDQIGASTGKNLGSLAKQMVAVSDGAISMQQAMSSTAMASAGGMTNQAILRMTEVAKKASLALGRDMTDSMDRITKGIIKTQPELLDELGIMTRVIPAQQEYARSIGKTAASLTDFEKRQAFANAVLAEGERKFGAIAMDANPYSKILASTNNLIQSGLELVNKVLGPLLNLLSSSPTGLAVALGGIAALLMRQAIPAIGMFRENAKKMAEESHQRVLRITADSEKRYKEEDTRAYAAGLNQFKIAKDTQDKIAALKLTKSEGIGSATLRKANINPIDMTNQELAQLEAKQKSLAKSENEAHKVSADMLKGHLIEVKKIRDAADAHAFEAEHKAITATQMRGDHESQLKKIRYKEEQQYSSRMIVAATSEEAAIMGPVKAWRLLNDEILKAKKNQNGNIGDSITNGMTRAKGAISIATSAISTAMNAFGVWAQAIGLVIAALGILDTWMTVSAKEAAAYNDSLETLNSSFGNVARTLENINRKPSNEFLSVESVQAKANALNDLTSNLENTVDKFNKLLSAQGGWEKGIDWLWDKVGKGNGDKLSKAISQTVIDAFSLMEEGPAKKKAQDAINSIAGAKIDMSSVKAFNAGIKDLDEDKIAEIGKITSKALSEASREFNNGASSLTAFKTALADVNKQATTISNGLIPTDEFSKLGVVLNAAASSMATALNDPINGLVALKELAGDMKTLSLLPEGAALQLANAKQEIDRINVSLANAKKEEAESKSRVDSAKAIVDKNGPIKEQMNVFKIAETQDAMKVLSIEQSRYDTAKSRVKLDTEAADKLRDTFKEIPRLLAAAAFDKLSLGLNKAMAEAGVSAAKGYLDVIKSAGAFTDKMDADLSKQQIAIQIEEVKTRYSNTIALTNLTLEVQRNTLAQERSSLASDIREQKGFKTDDQAKKLATLDKSIGEMDLAKAISQSGSKNIRALANAANSKTADDSLKNAMGMLTDVVAQSFGKDSQLAKLYADMGNADLKSRAGDLTDKSNIRKQSINAENKNLVTAATDLVNIQAINGMYNTQLQTAKELNAEAQLKNKYKLEEEDITTKIAINNIGLEKFKSTKDTKGLAEAERNAAALQTSLSNVRLEKETQLGVLSSKNFQERLAGEKQLAVIKQDNDNARLQYINDIKAAEDTANEGKLSYFKEIGVLTDAEYTKQSAVIKAAAEERKFQQEILLLKQSQATEQDVILAKIKAANDIIAAKAKPDFVGPVDTSNETALIEQQNKLLTDAKEKHNNILYSKQAQNTAAQEALAIQTAHNVLIKEQADQMTKMQGITESLTTAFGEMGAVIGKVGEVVLKMAQDEASYAKNKADAEFERDAANTEKDKAKAIENLKKIESNKTKSDLDNISKVAGATKKMFDEKSAGYKILNGIEKASAVASAAIRATELAQNIAATAAKIGIDIPGIYASFMKTMGPWGPPAAAAAIAAFLGGFGGSSSAPAYIPNSADRQETQGTGMSIDANGNKVANGGEVFGDATAKSNSIQNSLELIAETSVQGMSYSNKTLDILTSIDRGINNLAQVLYEVQGIRTGTNFGTVEGNSGGGGGLMGLIFGSSSTSTAIVNAGITLKGTFMELATAGTSASAVLNQFETVQTTSTSSGFLGIFGKSTSTSVKENIAPLEQKVREQIGGIFNNAAKLFEEQGDKLGAAEGYVVATLSTINVDKLASLRGLKGKELQDELKAVIGSIMDDAAKTLFPKLEPFKKFGEGYAQTVTRVLDTNNKIGLAFKQLGRPLAKLPEVASKATTQMVESVSAAQRKLEVAKANLAAFKPVSSTVSTGYEGSMVVDSRPDPSLTDAVTQSELELAAARAKVDEANRGLTVNNLTLTEDLANAAGGLDKFLELTSKFTDDYLSPVEKAGPRIGALRDLMGELGVSTDITKEGVKNLILNYEFETDASGKVTDASTKQYVGLLKLADAYTETSSAIDEVVDKLGLSSSSIKDILKNAVENAKSEEEARALGTAGAADAIGAAMQDALLSGITNIISGAMNTIVGNLITGSTASAINLVTGGAVGGANVASGSAVAGANLASAGAVSGSNIATAGAVAGANLAAGGADAANSMTAGASNVRTVVAGAITQVKSFVSTFVEVMKDPGVQSSLRELTAGFGEFAAQAYTGSSAVSSFTSSIGGTAKAASGSGGGSGGAAGAANDLASAWQAAADSIFAEVARIREMMVGTGSQALDAAQAKFDAATALARAGDIEAAKDLPKLSAALLTTAEATASSLLDLRRVQGATQASLEQTGLGAVAQYGLKLPSYDVGTNYVEQDQIAMIHQGEAIIPKAYNNNTNDALIREIQALRQEVSELRNVTRISGEYTKKTSDTLTRVTLGGEAMQTEVVASIPVPVA